MRIRKRYIGIWALVLLSSIWLGAIVLPKEKIIETVALSAPPVLVIDPGHGGADGGACGLNGTVEAPINWSIAVKVRDIAAFLGVKTVMTRETEDIPYPADVNTISARKKWDTKTRAELINSIPGAVLLSIHQNIYPTPTPSGSEVLYGSVGSSRELAEIVQGNLISALYPENRRVAIPARDGIYLMEHAKCPAVLVECGFLSNERESVLLCRDDHKLKIASILAVSFMEYTGEREA